VGGRGWVDHLCIYVMLSISYRFVLCENVRLMTNSWVCWCGLCKVVTSGRTFIQTLRTSSVHISTNIPRYSHIIVVISEIVGSDYMQPSVGAVP